MSRKSHTTATFSIRINLPIGSNVAQAQQFIRTAIIIHAGLIDTNNPFRGLTGDCFTVALTKKETTYGVHNASK